MSGRASQGLDSAERIFRLFLRKRGLRATPVRAAILQAILSRKDHFDADELFLDLRRQGLSVSRASVYRTLPLVIEAGLLNQIYSEDGHSLYERTYGREHHCHLRCLNCRRVVEFKSEEMDRLEKDLARRHGFKITAHQVEVYGLCPDCQGKSRD